MKKRTMAGNFLFLLLLTPIFCFSQTSFIQTADVSLDKLANTSQKRIASIQQSEFTDEWTLVSFSDLAVISDAEGAFLLEVPNAPYSYTVRPDDQADNSEYWTGKVYNSAGGEEGDILLLFSEKKVFGHFETLDGNFEIIPLEANLSILQKLDDHELAKHRCNGHVGESIQRETPAHVEPTDKSLMCDVTILVVYNNTTIIEGADAQSIATAAMAQTNTALDNSNLNNNVNLVAVQQIAMPTTGNHSADLASLRLDTETNTLRSLYNADIVIMLTNSNYDVGGVTYLFGGANFAYGLVEVDNATSTFTFSHEVFHIFGCDHQQCSLTVTPNCTSDVGFNHGYKYTKMIPIPIFPGVAAVTETTNMHVLESPNKRKLRVSNPDVVLYSAPTGVDNTNDNARVIENNACTVATWGETFTNGAPLTLTASISGPSWGYDGQWITLSSTVNGGTAPYTYNWEVSSNGSFYWSVGNSANLNYQLWYPGPSKILFFRLTVTSADGQTVVVQKHVLVYRKFGKFLVDDPNSAMTLNNYPNPANDATTIEYLLQDPTQVVLELLNQNGSVIAVLEEGEFSAGRYTVPVDLSNLSSGIYFYQLKTDDDIKTNSLLISK